MPTDSTKNYKTDIYNDGNPNQYARHTFTTPGSFNPALIIHVTPSSVRTETADLLEDKIEQDMQQQSKYRRPELYQTVPQIGAETQKQLDKLLKIIKPIMNRFIVGSGPIRHIGAGTLSAEPISIDLSVAVKEVHSFFYGKTDEDGKSTETLGARLKRKIFLSVIKNVLKNSSFQDKLEEGLGESERHKFYGLDKFKEDKPKNPESPIDADKIFKRIEGETERSYGKTSEMFFELSKINQLSTSVLYTSQPDLGATIVKGLIAKEEFDHEMSLYSPSDNKLFVEGDMVKPTINRSNGDNDFDDSPMPSEYLSVLG